MEKRPEAVQFIVTIGVDNAISIHNEDASMGYGWGPGTTVATEIIEALEDEGLI